MHPKLHLKIDGEYVPVETVYAPLYHHVHGLMETASGYGLRLRTPYKVRWHGRLCRVYCTCISNVGTCWIKVSNTQFIVEEL